MSIRVLKHRLLFDASRKQLDQLAVDPDLNGSVWKDFSITVPVALGRHAAASSVLPADLTKESLACRSTLSQVHFGITLLISGGESELLDPVHLHKSVIKLVVLIGVAQQVAQEVESGALPDEDEVSSSIC